VNNKIFLFILLLCDVRAAVLPPCDIHSVYQIKFSSLVTRGRKHVLGNGKRLVELRRRFSYVTQLATWLSVILFYMMK
jgi:hypothetical protein